MKCNSCGKEMVNTVGGSYQCSHCGMEIHDEVYRPPEFNHRDSGWNFPRIEHVRSKEPVRHVLNLAPKEVVIGETTLSNIIDRMVAVADSMNALAEELRKTMDREVEE